MASKKIRLKIRIRKIERRTLVRGLLLAALFGTMAVAGAVVGTYVAVRKTLPDVSVLETFEPALMTTLYGDDGRALKEIGPERRIIVDFAEIPEVLRQAIIATEDPRFFKHRGIDMRGVLRAVRENVLKMFRRRKLEGGSTITQQLARRLFLHPLQTLQRKFAEWFLAVQIEKRYSKEKIFEMYCNLFEFGYGAFGVEAASRLFFGKSVGELSLEEAAVIAGILRGPSRYSPYRNPALVLERRNHVLNRMAEEGFLSRAQAEAAKSTPLAILPQGRGDSEFGAYFFEEVRRYLVDAYGEESLYRGFKVHLTINAEYQRLAEAALAKGLREYDRRRGWRKDKRNLLKDEAFLKSGRSLEEARLPGWTTPRLERGDVVEAVVLSAGKKDAEVLVKGYRGRVASDDIQWTGQRSLDALVAAGDVVHVLVKAKDEEKKECLVSLEQEPRVQAGFLGLDVRTGQVKFMIGGTAFAKSQLNRAYQTARQAGSSIKPFLYTAALENGFTAASRVVDEPTDFPDKWSGETWAPRNYDRLYKGTVTLRKGIEESRNVVTAKVLDNISPQTGVDYCKRFGLTTTLYPYLSLALGTFDVRLVEMVSAMSVFPNKGVRARPYFISRIEDRDGNVLEEAAIETEEVISPQTAYLMTYLLQGVTQRGTAAGQAASHLADKALGGKTGTTDRYTDAWFIGFSPSLCAGVWVGHDDNLPLGHNESGAVAALPVWAGFFRSLIEDEKRKAKAEGREVVREEFDIPPNIHFETIDLKTGLLIPPSGVRCLWPFREAFLEGTEPRRYCSYEDHLRILHYAGVDTAKEESDVPPPPAKK
ncbi:MAG: PBP1A family penicillin-binding protein [Candidatus Aminicenantes bacterium]|nr:PBP1A family penicillin-binding protein [Candidatus Aminicenantes bacterium]